MLFMNRWEIEEAFLRSKNNETPNRERGAAILYNLMNWTDRNSDGWAYWPKPCRAARKLQEALQSGDRWEPEDITDAELKAALTPIKAFLTRQGVAHEEVFDNYLTS